jgi:hypothetical protein
MNEAANCFDRWMNHPTPIRNGNPAPLAIEAAPMAVITSRLGTPNRVTPDD